MRNLFTIIFISVITTFTYAQSKKIEIGVIDSINSKILNEKRDIWVYVPHNVTNGMTSKKNYPVLYLLDGDWHFVSVVGLLQHLSYTNGNTICPEMIVVGIPSTDRYRDMTPSCDSMYSEKSGGNEKFISFIENELIPHIDSLYPVEPYRMIVGHSLGGLTVINTLINHTELFNSFVAIDPSMWWNNQSSLRETNTALSKNEFFNKSLFLAIANTMDKGIDTATVKKDNSRKTLPIRSNLEFSDILNKYSQNNLNYMVKYYQNENHGSIPLIATYDALHFVFDFYNLSLTKSDYTDTTMSIVNKIENHYKNVSERMGYKVTPTENTLYVFAINSQYMNNLPLAEHFLLQNITYHPDSFIAHDSYGDYYVSKGNYEQASIMYKKALSIYDNDDTRKKLENIKK